MITYADLYKKRMPDTDNEGNQSEPVQKGPSPSFIHLRSAKIYAAGQRPLPTTGMLWRGKISSVDGFTIGVLSEDG